MMWVVAILALAAVVLTTLSLYLLNEMRQMALDHWLDLERMRSLVRQRDASERMLHEAYAEIRRLTNERPAPRSNVIMMRPVKGDQ